MAEEERIPKTIRISMVSTGANTRQVTMLTVKKVLYGSLHPSSFFTADCAKGLVCNGVIRMPWSRMQEY